MDLEENKAVVLDFYQAFDSRDIDKAFSLLAPNFVAHMAGISKSLDGEGFKQFGMEFYSAFTDGQHHLDEVIAQGNKIVTCGTFMATHSGEFQGLPPTGKQIKISIMHLDCVENGEIIEHWGQGDTQGLMQQLGIVFFPSPQLILSILKNNLIKFFK